MNNRRMILHLLGNILLVEAGVMILPVIVALIYRESAVYSFVTTMILLAVVGSALVFFPVKDKRVYYKDGFIVVSLGWVFISLFGALPFYLSGEIPSYLDALFEAVSGFTTTGASILSNVEVLSRSILFWRSFTHWIGGMGVLVFIMALMPLARGGGNLNLMRAESPGVEVEKLVPKSNSTARILYGIYLFLTLLQLSFLLAGKMPLFDALTVTFGTAGTGGFSILNSSIASYTPYHQTVVTVFMVLFGINFNLYFLVFCKKWKDALKNEELKYYLAIFISAVVIVTADIYFMNVYSSVKDALHHASFQVASIMTTTGFATADFNLWPEVSRVILLFVMCIGACAGSTAGGLKVSRVVLLFKSVSAEIKRIIHPRSVSVVTFNKKRVNDDVIRTTNVYFIVYVIIFTLSLIVVSFDRMDFISNVSGVIATLNNIGPGLEVVGPTGNFSIYSPLSKVVFIFDMLLGRLEIFPLLILFSSLLRIKRVKIDER